MFAIIQYYDYRKEVSIVPHGLFSDLKSAETFVSKLILNKEVDNYSDNYFYSVRYGDPEYVHIGNSPTSKLICTLRGYRIPKVTEDFRADIMEGVEGWDEEEYAEHGITVNSVLEYFECDDEHRAKVTEVFPLDEKITDNFPRQIELLDFIAKHDLGDMDIYEHSYEHYSGYLFGIIEMNVVKVDGVVVVD